MELTEFTFRIILLFIPGIISFLLIDKLTNHKEFKLFQIIIFSYVLGFICYSLYYLTTLIFQISTPCSFFEALSNNQTRLNFNEIIYVTGISIPTGFFVTSLINYKVLFRVARFLRISNVFGDLDVWSYIMNSKIPPWIIIRDIKNDLMYEGWVVAFSDSTERDELFLRDVKVFFNSTAEELYQVPGLYLPLSRKDLTIEFPLMDFSEQINRPKKEETEYE